MPEQILFSKRQAAQVLSISLRTLDKLILLKRLPVHKIGRRVLISRTSIERFAIGGEKSARPITNNSSVCKTKTGADESQPKAGD